MFETVADPIINPSDLRSGHKKPGLGAFVRLKNEQDFAQVSIESILPFFEEIVITFNDCSDGTPDIVADLERKYPDRIKAYRYLPVVVAPGTHQHRTTPSHSPHSLEFYSNFGMSKVSYQIRCKWDGDQIAEPRAFGQVIQRMRELKSGSLEWWLSPWRLGYWWYEGVNLWDKDGKVYVIHFRPHLGRRRDHGIWGAGRFYVFKKEKRYEYLFTRLMRHRAVGAVFYHLKGMKRDRGTSVFAFEQHPTSNMKDFIEQNWTDPPLFTYQEYQRDCTYACQLPDPETIGIRPLFPRQPADKVHDAEPTKLGSSEPSR